MKLNIISILNNIAAEEATVSALVNPNASWNINSEKELKNAYDYYKMHVEMENANTFDLIEHCEKYGWDYSHIHFNKLLTWEEWLAKEMEMRSRYMVMAA